MFETNHEQDPNRVHSVGIRLVVMKVEPDLGEHEQQRRDYEHGRGNLGPSLEDVDFSDPLRHVVVVLSFA